MNTAEPMRILFISPLSPFGQAAGGQQRTAQLLAALQPLGEVDTLVIQPGHAHCIQHDENLRQTTITVPSISHRLGGYAPDGKLSAFVLSHLPTAIGDYDLVIGRFLRPVCLLDIPEPTPVIVDLDDFDYRFDHHSLRSPAVWREWLKHRLGHRLARRQLPRFAGAFFVSERDLVRCGFMHSTLLPNVPRFPRGAPPRNPDGKTILFVGSMWYRPNQEAVEWFLSHVFPRIRAARPDTCFNIVGAAPEALRNAWMCTPGVLAPGFVDDLAAVYASASVVVAPIHSGGGTNIKILEALAHACPCVTTPFSYHALNGKLHAGEHLLVPTSAPAFADACLHLLGDEDEAARLGAAGRDVVARHFSTQEFDTEVQRFVTRIVPTTTASIPT